MRIHVFMYVFQELCSTLFLFFSGSEQGKPWLNALELEPYWTMYKS